MTHKNRTKANKKLKSKYTNNGILNNVETSSSWTPKEKTHLPLMGLTESW